MSRLPFLVLLLSCFVATARAAPLKVASVDMERLFREYHRAEAAQKEIGIEQARIQRQSNDRLGRIKEIEAALEKLRRQVDDPAVAASKKHGLAKEWEELRREGVELERERRDFLERRGRMLRERVVQQARALHAEVLKRVEEEAKAEDYDHVFDISAVSVSGTKFILSSGGSDDLTDRLLTKLNAGAAEEKTGKPAAE